MIGTHIKEHILEKNLILADFAENVLVIDPIEFGMKKIFIMVIFWFITVEILLKNPSLKKNLKY